jgi:hypothetical protein
MVNNRDASALRRRAKSIEITVFSAAMSLRLRPIDKLSGADFFFFFSSSFSVDSQTSMGPPPRRNPAPPRSAPGPAASAWPCPIAAESDPKSGKPGATHTASPEAETIEHTHTDNVCQVQFDRLEITEAATQNQTSDLTARKEICPERNRSADFPGGSVTIATSAES